MKEGVNQSKVTAVIKQRVLFKPRSWLAKIDFINHLILFNNVLITVLSEKDGGKTSFGSLLQNTLHPQVSPIFITTKPPYNREDLIKDLADRLQCNLDDTRDIVSIAHHINERKLHVLFLIDDAHHLSEELIKELLVAVKGQGDFGFFHVCFISDYSIVASLNALSSSSFDDLIHTIELGLLNETETRTYVLQRAMAAHFITKPLTDAQFKQLYQLTKGNIAKINHNLESFVFKCATHKKQGSFKRIKLASFAVSIVFIVAFLGFYFSSTLNFNPSYFLRNLTADQEKIHRTAVKRLEPPKILPSYITSWHDFSTRQLVYAAFPKKHTQDELDNDVALETKAILDKVVVIPQIETKKLRVEDTKVKSSKTVLKQKLVKISIAKKIKPNHLARKKSFANRPKQNKNRYTIQLAASHNKQNLERFQRNNKTLLQKTKLRHFTNATGVWYVLTLGEYESKDQAQLKAGQLATPLAKLHPWVRPVSHFG